MTRASLEAALPVGTALVLDTSALLAYLDGTESASPAAAVVLDDFVRQGRNAATVSAVTVAELLVRPFAASAGAVATIETFLGTFPSLMVSDVDYEVAREAALIRAGTGLGMPDSLVIATAVIRSISHVVTNDSRWGSAVVRAGIEVAICHLGAHLPL